MIRIQLSYPNTAGKAENNDLIKYTQQITGNITITHEGLEATNHTVEDRYTFYFPVLRIRWISLGLWTRIGIQAAGKMTHKKIKKIKKCFEKQDIFLRGSEACLKRARSFMEV